VLQHRAFSEFTANASEAISGSLLVSRLLRAAKTRPSRIPVGFCLVMSGPFMVVLPPHLADDAAQLACRGQVQVVDALKPSKLHADVFQIQNRPVGTSTGGYFWNQESEHLSRWEFLKKLIRCASASRDLLVGAVAFLA